MQELIPPHGGTLAERLVRGPERDPLIRQALDLPSVTLDEWETADLELLSGGALSPLEGFLGEADYDSVLERLELANGTVWPFPVTLSLSQQEAEGWRQGQDLALKGPEGKLLAVLHQPELYRYNPLVEAKLVYGSTDPGHHPAVKRLLEQGPYHAGGKVSVVRLPKQAGFTSYRLTPAQTRAEFSRRGWSRVVGFQTRNPIHRAHEYLLRCALETADGLMIQPMVGPGVEQELPAALRVRCCEKLIGVYLPQASALLVVSPAGLRYAGPREEVLHAIIRQNYGCSHFIVGRDSPAAKPAGQSETEQLFNRFGAGRLAVTPLYFDNAFYCRACQGMATAKTCAHRVSERVPLSATALKQILSDGKEPPPEFTRPEIAEILKGNHASQTG